MENLESAEENRHVNKSLADQIKGIVTTAGRNGTWIPLDKTNRDFTRMHRVNLNAFKSEESLVSSYGERIHELLADDMGFPIYTFQDLPADVKNEIIETPYGRQPAIVVGMDDGIYQFSNQYFFDDSGNAYRYEHVLTVKAENDPATDFPRIDHVPKEEDSRIVSINPVTSPGVYEKMGAILNQIEEGKYKLATYRVSPGF